MSLVTTRTNVSPDGSTAIVSSQVSGNTIAGEDILAGAPCRIGADGLIYMSSGAAAGANARVHGMSARAARQGQPITLYAPGTRYGYSAGGLTPGQPLFLSTTAGRLDTVAQTGDATGVAFAVNATDIMFAAYRLV